MKTRNIMILILLLFTFSCNNNHKSDAYGNFEAREIIVSSESNGKLLLFPVEEGDRLDSVMLTAVVDTVPSYLQLQQLKATRDAVSSKIKNILSQIDVYQEQKATLNTEKERIENLLKDGAATQKQLDDVNAQLKILDKQVRSVETQNSSVLNEIKSMDWQIRLMRQNLDKCKIYNPVKGTILEKYMEEDEIVTIGKPLYKIANMEELELRVYVSGDQLPHIRLGQQVEVLIDKSSNENQALTGKVIWISDQAEFSPKIIQTKEERVKLVYAVKILVKNDGRLKIGMPGEINFM